MSLRDYMISRDLDARSDALGSEIDWGEDFYALVMLLYRHADTMNKIKLEEAWPEICTEYRERYDAPAGLLVGEKSLDGKMERREDGLYEDDKLVRAC